MRNEFGSAERNRSGPRMRHMGVTQHVRRAAVTLVSGSILAALVAVPALAAVHAPAAKYKNSLKVTIAGTGSLAKTGTGTLVLTGAATQTGGTVISEELGMIGATLVVLCFCVIAWRGLRTAMRAPDSFGAFLALGITMMLVLQALFNISVVLGLVPTKGIPLPLVSNGGSSMLINLLAVGVLLNISQHQAVDV